MFLSVFNAVKVKCGKLFLGLQRLKYVKELLSTEITEDISWCAAAGRVFCYLRGLRRKCGNIR